MKPKYKWLKPPKITDDYWIVDLRPDIEKLKKDPEYIETPPPRCSECEDSNHCIRVNMTTREQISYCEECCSCPKGD